MARGTPLIYPPRHGFAEHRSLDRTLRAWGGGVPISSREFRALKLNLALETALQINPPAPPFPADGADWVARYLTAVCRKPGSPPPLPAAPRFFRRGPPRRIAEPHKQTLSRVLPCQPQRKDPP